MRWKPKWEPQEMWYLAKPHVLPHGWGIWYQIIWCQLMMPKIVSKSHSPHVLETTPAK